MIVDEPQGYMYYGSLVAAPFAGKVFEKIFDYTGLQPTLLPEKEYSVIPDVVDMPIEQAIKSLEELGFHVESTGEGGTVTAQTPVPGTRVAKNDSVLVRT